ncbi:ABC transporter permease [Clostridium sp. 'deep sea']|uniref:ABC transporter permease n=1 Tax=Clostridium sp. 'deep sea' TaxID=2779445 RepID=UPI0018966B76|nr:ABC transporter permease [Clostridium sp. 'deep sea']QOR36765.1 ABC transporter permease [Clostridium sp. 'deep sea']
MNEIKTIVIRNLKEQFKSPIFWAILVLFPLAMLFMFNEMFVNDSTHVANSAIKITILNVTDNHYAFSKLAIVVLAQFFLISSVVASGSLIQVKTNKTLMRIFTYPITKSKILIAHFLSVIIELTVVMSLVMILISVIFKVVWSINYFGLVITSLLCIILCSSFGLFLSLLFKNGNIASGIMSGVVILMSFLNGDMTSGKLPFKNSDFFTLNKWITSAFNKLYISNNFSNLYKDILVILCLGLGFTILSIVLFSKENSYE